MVSITLLLVLLLRSSEFDQLVKIPALISHYIEHTDKDGKLSFAQFITMHYQSEKGHSEDNDHKDLPFKAHDCQNFSQILVLEAFIPTISVQIQILKDQSVAFCDDHYFLENLVTIWQPPQILA